MLELRDLSANGPAGDALVTTTQSFGTRYNAFRDFEDFAEQVEETSLGMIIWPGGTLAEVNNGLYGFQHEGLFDPNASLNRPDLEDIFSFAAENGMAVSIVLPTAIYQDDPDALKQGATDFLEDVYSGKFGPLPDKLIFEIGNEYYDVFDGNSLAQATDYGEVVNAYSEVISDIEQRFEVNPDQVRFSVQLGKSEAANDALLEVLSDESLLMTDLLSHHRFVFEPNGAGKQVEDVAEGLNDWEDAVEALGGEAPNLYLSAYNTASLTRKEAAQLYERENPGEDIDHQSRSNLDFERYYQSKLDTRAHGLEHGENLLQIFSEYQPLGVEAAGVYGWDTVHAARSSIEGTDGEPYIFAGGATQDMMAESLIGTRALDWYEENDHRDPDDVSLFGFDSADKLVVFMVAPEFEGDSLRTSLSMEDLGETIAVWGESLTAETPDNWHELFDIPRTPGVDQSPEAETFAVADREAFTPDIRGQNVEVEFSQPGEIVRLTFARTEAGRAEIETWQDGAGADISADAPGPLVPPTVSPPPDEVDPDEDIDAAEAEDDGSSFPFEALLLGLLLPLLGLG
ncbi:hypothetical protein [uncultured Litoreibacter sp.]|uniref:hypothetical protein n=1 Tax=uncultured Litoreibacter sp. TaxID=1392394 RepID=UPI0026358852|nr:hypothetical protein [uncultured Litoreibacter sp.]